MDNNQPIMRNIFPRFECSTGGNIDDNVHDNFEETDAPDYQVVDVCINKEVVENEVQDKIEYDQSIIDQENTNSLQSKDGLEQVHDQNRICK